MKRFLGHILPNQQALFPGVIFVHVAFSEMTAQLAQLYCMSICGVHVVKGLFSYEGHHTSNCTDSAGKDILQITNTCNQLSCNVCNVPNLGRLKLLIFRFGQMEN